MSTKKIIFILCGIFWPLELYLNNQPHDFLIYTLPVIFIAISFWLYKKESKLFPYPLLVIPFIDVKLTVFPLVFFLGLIIFKIRLAPGLKIIFPAAALFILALNGNTLRQNSVLKLEYEAKQEVLREIHLYPNTFLARTFQNKGRIILDKFTNNFFALLDPGNYFFAFHPREGKLINQNLVKFPFLAIVPIFWGLLKFKRLKYNKFIVTILLAGILSLSFIEIFDRSDFILWFPLVYVFIFGIEIIYKSKNVLLRNMFFFLLITNALIELTRILYLYKI